MGHPLSYCSRLYAWNIENIENDIEITSRKPIEKNQNLDIFFREDVILIYKLRSLLMTIDKYKKKLKSYKVETFKPPSISNMSTDPLTEFKLQIKYQILAEKLTLSLKHKKKLINDHIHNLKIELGTSNNSLGDFEVIYNAKKAFNKYDEFQDKIAQDVFEMERSYKNDIQGYNNGGPIGSKTTLATFDKKEKKARILSGECLTNPLRSSSIQKHLNDHNKKEMEQEISEFKFSGNQANNWNDYYKSFYNRNTRKDVLFRSKSKSKSRSIRNGGSFQSLNNNYNYDSDKVIYNALRSKNVYKEEKQEFNKKVDKLFKKYNVNDADVKRQMRQMNNKSNDRKFDSGKKDVDFVGNDVTWDDDL